MAAVSAAPKSSADGQSYTRFGISLLNPQSVSGEWLAAVSEAVPGLTAKRADSQLILEAVQSGGQPVSVLLQLLMCR